MVIGAGNTAIDAANAARRAGRASVAILYRRGERDMSAFTFEYEHAKREGVKFLWRNAAHVRIHTDERGIRSIECVQSTIGAGWRTDRGSWIEFRVGLPMQIIPRHRPVAAAGAALAACRGSEHGARARGRSTAPPAQTSDPKYFAGGDCVNGGREVVDAVADGKRAGIAHRRRRWSPCMPEPRWLI